MVSENDLFQQIGLQLTQDQHSGLPLSAKKLIERGKKWFESKQEALRDSVCSNETIWKLAKENAEEQAIILAIADLITSVCVGVSPITVATLLSKYSIEKFCLTRWGKSNLNAE